MKKVLLFEEYIGEGKGWAKLMKAVKAGSKSGPWSIVSIEGGKVVNQELVNVMDAIPAHYEEVKKRFPNAKMSIEDNEGMSVYNESIINESDAYTISRMANDVGLGRAEDFLDKYNVDLELLTNAVRSGSISKYELRDIINGNVNSSKMKQFVKTYVNEATVNEAKTLTREELMDLLESKYKIKTVRTSEEFNGQTKGIWVAGDNEEELNGNRIFYYYNNSTSKYANGILKQVKTAVEKTGWRFEWNDPGTIMIWPNK